MARSSLASLALAAVIAMAGCGRGTDEFADSPGAEEPGEGTADPDDGDADPGSGGGAPDAPPPDAPARCAVAADCEAAAATCCECPTFSLPVSEGYGAACEDVDCGPPPDDTEGGACAPTRVQCDGGTCRLFCEAVACDVRCEFGFAPDPAGCLRCSADACAPEPPAEAECTLNSDCARVPADCCGCAEGGADTSVPVGRVDEHIEGLECDAAPICPGVDICDPADVPRCIDGTCMLAPDPGGEDDSPEPPGDEPAVCGTPDRTCPAGQVCVLNDPEAQEATNRGLGVCRAL